MRSRSADARSGQRDGRVRRRAARDRPRARGLPRVGAARGPAGAAHGCRSRRGPRARSRRVGGHGAGDRRPGVRAARRSPVGRGPVRLRRPSPRRAPGCSRRSSCARSRAPSAGDVMTRASRSTWARRRRRQTRVPRRCSRSASSARSSALTALVVPGHHVFVASQRAANAADAAALAAADAISGAVPGVPCALAATVAARNGACSCSLQHRRPRGLRRRGGPVARLRTRARRREPGRRGGRDDLSRRRSPRSGTRRRSGGRRRPRRTRGPRPGCRCSACPCRC